MTAATSSGSRATDRGASAVVRKLLVRGLAAGLVGGLAYFVFAYLFGEDAVEAAIAYEEQTAAAAGDVSAEAPLVSRGIQSTLGLGVAAMIYGVAIGGVVGLAYASDGSDGSGRGRPRRRSLRPASSLQRATENSARAVANP